MSVIVHPFYEPSRGSYSYIVANPESGCCAIIDPLLGIDESSGTTNTHAADLLLDWVRAHDFVVRWVLETQADEASACAYLKSHLLCAQSAVGAGSPAAGARDKALHDGDKLCLDHACGHVMALPTGAVGYQFCNAVFTGDALLGSDRCTALARLLELPEETLLYVRRGIAPGPNPQSDSGVGCCHKFVTTVAQQRSLRMASPSLSG